MNYTVFLPFACSFPFPNGFLEVLDYVEEYLREGHRVSVVYCDGRDSQHCFLNPLKRKDTCRLCRIYRSLLCSALPSRKHLQWLKLSEYVQGNDYPRFTYASTRDIKGLEYKGVKVGYAALSNFLTVSRNLYPAIDADFREYFDNMLQSACRYTDAVLTLLDQTHPEVVICFNSRSIYARPVIDLARQKKLPFLSVEGVYNTRSELRKICFKNAVPHDPVYNHQRMVEAWNRSKLSAEERLKVAESFFYKRRHSIASGDKLYVKDQQLGLLPDHWDNRKHNILILNSSEDEYASLGEEFDNKSVFPTQFHGIKRIVEHFRQRDDLHFYLRVHPNLKQVNYLYHTRLYELASDNFTIIPPDSPISTYALIDAADKVVVFGSTTGPEAVYWGKPCILLSYCLYSECSMCHLPRNEEECFNMIENTQLPAIGRDAALQFGYFRLNDENDDFVLFRHQRRTLHWFGRNFDVHLIEIGWWRKCLLAAIQILGKRLYYKHFYVPKKEDASSF